MNTLMAETMPADYQLAEVADAPVLMGEPSPIDEQEQLLNENFARMRTIGMVTVYSMMRENYDPATAEDIVQGVVLRTWRGYDPDKGDLAAYVAISARNATVDHFRKQSSRVSETLIEIEDEGLMSLLPADPDPGPEEHAADDSEGLESLVVDILRSADCKEEIIPEYVQILKLTSYGYTAIECAGILGIPRGTVSRRLAYTREHLQARSDLLRAFMAGEDVEVSATD